ncbi:hypothetical protein SHI21_08565 [Bacteriovorax sp. PP10]|uniref:Uncharacterized protein n=1 Tax=Bacteriovorax antarcticus TaxID=3088717 RepID=A0ABU5VUG6_9BACT|nr:hypothetical protein [Bacteriovorax sp. PP10]MEA9356252.1 hypothetical protein [Bacteriovorax sp. PP10]
MKNFNYKRIFFTPVYWMFVITVVIDAFLEYFFKERYNTGYSFLISLIYGIQDDFVAVKLREFLGFEPIRYLRAIEIGIIAGIKLLLIPLLLIIILLSLIPIFYLTGSREILNTLPATDGLIISYVVNIVLVWMFVGVNYAFFTNDISDINRRSFEVIKEKPKKFFIVIIIYTMLLSLGSFSRNMPGLEIVVNALVLLIASVPLRCWLYKIFSEIKTADTIEELR